MRMRSLAIVMLLALNGYANAQTAGGTSGPAGSSSWCDAESGLASGAISWTWDRGARAGHIHAVAADRRVHDRFEPDVWNDRAASCRCTEHVNARHDWNRRLAERPAG